jgi:hypothetical protein
MRALPLTLGVLVFTSAVAAQERSLARFDLPREVERRLSVIVDDPGTRRLDGAAVIAAGETVAANVVAFDGPLTISGKIEGELIVLGGAVEFRAGSEVTGDVTVVGGEAHGTDFANIGGTLTTYGEGFELYHRGERILAVNTRHRDQRGRRRIYEGDWGRSAFTVRTGTNYNRVEGLPIMFGPMIETGGSSPTRVEALGILRTAGGDVFNTSRMGYVLRGEQFIGGRAFRVGAAAHSIVQPIESWNLSNLEASLATFLLHDDQRDYFDREGWGVYARLTPWEPLDLTVGYWDEDHSTRVSRDPWTLFGNGDWRSQPLIGEGRLRSLSARLEIDGRNREKFARSGVFLRAEATHGLEGSLRLPERTPFVDDPAFSFEPVELNQRFNHGLVDLRLYRRVGIDAALALRGVVGGSIDSKGIPPQYQHALGGAGTLPGFKLFSADCGARSAIVTRGTDGSRAFFPYYGCDRFAMGSIEYRGGLDFDFGGNFDFWGWADEDWDWHVDASPDWMVFFNAGRGWALDQSRTLGAVDTEILYDAGAGFLLGDFGIYGAVPLNGDKRGINFFIRLGARF